MAATKYVEITREGDVIQTVTEKAYRTLYASKGFRVTRDDVEPPAPREADAENDEAGDEPDPFDLEVARVLRQSVANVVDWINAAEGDDVKVRATAVFKAENVKAQPRASLLDAAAGIAAEPGEGDGGDQDKG